MSETTLDLEELEKQAQKGLEDLKGKEVTADNQLKELFVNYVGQKLQPENAQVTVDMIVGVLADEFPDFLLVVAEENFVRGYEQAYKDIEEWNRANSEEFQTNKVDVWEQPED